MISDTDFTFNAYRTSLENYLLNGYAVTGFLGYLDQVNAKHLILRHDCDNSLTQAMRIAKLDQEIGVTSTFFVRIHATGYNLLSLQSLNILNEIQNLGHEVELHLEGGLEQVLGGDVFDWATRQKNIFSNALGRDLNGFSVHEPARMGGISVANSLFENWNVRYHAYQEQFQMPNMKYLSDSSARWREGHFGNWVNKVDQLQVLVHPIWWYEKIPQENY